jgi:hypothetical protein
MVIIPDYNSGTNLFVAKVELNQNIRKVCFYAGSDSTPVVSGTVLTEKFISGTKSQIRCFNK